MKSAEKTVVFLPAHPAQLWMMQALSREVAKFARVKWALRDKDNLVQLANRLQLGNEIFTTAGTGVFGNGVEFLRGLKRAFEIERTVDPDLWFTKYGPANMVAKLRRKISISFNDDDADIVPLIAWTSYPFSEHVLTPSCTRMGAFEKKAWRYNSYHELFYLHPNRFTPDPSIRSQLCLSEGEKFGIIRLSSLKAHHDLGIRGMAEKTVSKIIELFSPRCRIFISSESPLSENLKPYRISIPPDRIHHAMAFAEFYVGDSQTMAAEAAVLGTPSFRLSDFAGRISYLEDLERYELTCGFRPQQESLLIEKLKVEVLQPGSRDIRNERLKKLLAEKVDPIPIVSQLIKEHLYQGHSATA